MMVPETDAFSQQQRQDGPAAMLVDPPPDTNATNHQPVNPASPPLQVSAALPSLPISGLVVTKEALLMALRLYLPQIADITPLSENLFMLMVDGASSPNGEGK